MLRTMILNEGNTPPERGHNQRAWKAVRRRALLQQTTIDDWENADDFQRKVMHQIELAINSVIHEQSRETKGGEVLE